MAFLPLLLQVVFSAHCFFLSQCWPSSQISSQASPGFFAAPHGSPLPCLPPSLLPEDLLQSGGAQPLTWPHTQGPAANWLLVSMTLLGDYEDKEETLERAFSSKMLFVVTGQEKAISLGGDLAAGHSLTS